MSNFMKIRPDKAHLFSCGQRDRETWPSYLSLFANLRKSDKCQISWKSVQRKPRCFHADRGTDRHDEVICRFFANLRKSDKCQISWKSVQIKPSCFHAGRGTDRHDQAICRFSQICEKVAEPNNDLTRLQYSVKNLYNAETSCDAAV
jgi:hypothetical protein